MRMLQTTRVEAALRGPFLPADLAFPDSLRPPQCSSADRRRVRHLTALPLSCGVRRVLLTPRLPVLRMHALTVSPTGTSAHALRRPGLPIFPTRSRRRSPVPRSARASRLLLTFALAITHTPAAAFVTGTVQLDP